MDKGALDRSTRRFSRRKRSRNCVFGRIFSSLAFELLIRMIFTAHSSRKGGARSSHGGHRETRLFMENPAISGILHKPPGLRPNSTPLESLNPCLPAGRLGPCFFAHASAVSDLGAFRPIKIIIIVLPFVAVTALSLNQITTKSLIISRPLRSSSQRSQREEKHISLCPLGAL
jgi:hypothetical protein